jgi:hypothetical protein
MSQSCISPFSLMLQSAVNLVAQMTARAKGVKQKVTSIASMGVVFTDCTAALR